MRVKIGPPRLYEDKWYPQSELCDTTLLTVYATACDLQFPFGSPLTDNPCVNFQVLGSAYKKHLSILSTNDSKNLTHYETALFSKTAYYNTFETIAQLKPTGQTTGVTPTWQDVQNTTNLDASGTNQQTSNDTWYYGNTYKDNIKDLTKKPEIDTWQQHRKHFQLMLPCNHLSMNTMGAAILLSSSQQAGPTLKL